MNAFRVILFFFKACVAVWKLLCSGIERVLVSQIRTHFFQLVNQTELYFKMTKQIKQIKINRPLCLCKNAVLVLSNEL